VQEQNTDLISLEFHEVHVSSPSLKIFRHALNVTHWSKESDTGLKRRQPPPSAPRSC